GRIYQWSLHRGTSATSRSGAAVTAGRASTCSCTSRMASAALCPSSPRRRPRAPSTMPASIRCRSMQSETRCSTTSSITTTDLIVNPPSLSPSRRRLKPTRIRCRSSWARSVSWPSACNRRSTTRSLFYTFLRTRSCAQTLTTAATWALHRRSPDAKSSNSTSMNEEAGRDARRLLSL
ncbi:hypothetical protein PMAYCL1PPCAC_13630, partial [Pristionchus mayeri]